MLLSKKKTLTGKPLLWALTVVYFGSYMTRVNLAAIIQEVATKQGIERDRLSIVLVCLSISYGIGQIINGRLGDKFKPQNMIFLGSIISSTVNLIFPFFSFSIVAMAILWAINGFAQAMMWPPIVRIMVSNFDGEEYSSAQIFISWGTSLATILVYLISPLIILWSSWKVVFLFCGSVGAFGCVFWGMRKGRVSVELPMLASDDTPAEKQKMHFPAFALFPIILIALGVMCQGMLRDGVTAWTPSYLAEIYRFENENAILSTVILAIFSGVAFTIVGAIYKKWFKNEVFCACFVFLLAAACALALFFFGQKNPMAEDASSFAKTGGSIFAITMLTLVTGCMHGVNLMLVSHVPKRFKKYGNISTISGMINACSHLGAAIFTYGMAKLSVNIGWRWTFVTCFAIAAVGAILCLISSKRWKKMLD